MPLRNSRSKKRSANTRQDETMSKSIEKPISVYPRVSGSKQTSRVCVNY